MSPQTAFLLCGALAREAMAIAKARGWDVDFHGISAREHMTPVTIAPLVEAKLRELIPQYDRIIVLYGDCGTSGALDLVLAAYNVPRISGPHCYEMYGGAAHDALMAEEPGTFFLTDFLLRGFDGLMWKGLGLDKHPELRADYFANYKRLVYLAQEDRADLRAMAGGVAARLQLPLEIRVTGFGLLETRLAELMQNITAPQYAPRREALHHDHVSDPVLARHPDTGARARRPRARQRAAERPLSRGD
jgi:Protein of unknown function (DUF1638)